MNLSINPTYLCNFRCDFCYLTKQQLGERIAIDMDVLDARLKEVHDIQPIDHIDLYGGEVGILSEEYLTEMIDVIRKYYSGTIDIITNMYKVNPVFYRDDVRVSVSFDWDCRERYTDVLNNIIMFEKDIHILMLAGECLIKKDVDFMISAFNSFQNVKSVEIKPYSSNQANQQPIRFDDFEEFVKQWIGPEKNFEFINEKNIKESLSGERNAWSDDHVYITPTGNFAVLEFDLEDNEYFLEVDNISEYLSWQGLEKYSISENLYCKSCTYLGHCLSEHLREVKDLDHSCNGFKNLLDWYDERT